MVDRLAQLPEDEFLREFLSVGDGRRALLWFEASELRRKRTERLRRRTST
jgi:hypothetical protein